MAAVKRNSPFGSLRSPDFAQCMGVLEDKTKGKLSVLMEVYRGDLRNLMDLKMDNLKKKNGHAQEEIFLLIFSAISVLRRGLHLFFAHHKQWGLPRKQQ